MHSVGIDNGVSGSIAVIYEDGTSLFIPMSTITVSEQDYCKVKRNITRVNAKKLYATLAHLKGKHVVVMLERPMVNPGRFRATVSAVRCIEATLIVVQDMLELSIEYIDSKQWQKELLPMGCTGAELKTASRDLGIRKFPQHKAAIMKLGDADGLHIATYCRNRNVG